MKHVPIDLQGVDCRCVCSVNWPLAAATRRGCVAHLGQAADRLRPDHEHNQEKENKALLATHEAERLRQALLRGQVDCKPELRALLAKQQYGVATVMLRTRVDDDADGLVALITALWCLPERVRCAAVDPWPTDGTTARWSLQCSFDAHAAERDIADLLRVYSPAELAEQAQMKAAIAAMTAEELRTEVADMVEAVRERAVQLSMYPLWMYGGKRAVPPAGFPVCGLPR